MILKLPKTALCLFLLQTQGNWFPRRARSLFYRSITSLSAVGASAKDCLYIRSEVGKWDLSDWPREAWRRYIFPSGTLWVCSKDCQRNHQGRCFKVRCFSSKAHHRAEAQLPKTSPVCSVTAFSAVSSSASSCLASVGPSWLMLYFLRPPSALLRSLMFVFVVLRIETRDLGVH